MTIAARTSTSTSTRRQLFGLTARGIGAAALGSLLSPELLAAGVALQDARDPKTGGLTALPHFAPKAKRVIFLYQSGGPSQLEPFDYKPSLAKFQGTQIPDSVRKGQRVAQTMGQSLLPVAKSAFAFARTGRRGRGSASCCRTPRRSSTTSPSSSRCTPTRSITTRRSRSSRPASSSRAGRAWARGSATGWAARIRTCRRSSCCCRRRTRSRPISRSSRGCGGAASCRRAIRASGSAPAASRCCSSNPPGIDPHDAAADARCARRS